MQDADAPFAAINESPLMLDQGAAADAQEAAVIAEYNDLLASSLANFTSSNAGVTAKLVDTTTPFQTAIDDPQAYGAANATCYDDDGTSCLWWNNYHPGMASEYLITYFLRHYTLDPYVQKEGKPVANWIYLLY